jgi:hypothetical protein
LSVALRAPEPAVRGAAEVRLCQTGRTVAARRDSEWLHFEIPRVLDHEVAVVG